MRPGPLSDANSWDTTTSPQAYLRRFRIPGSNSQIVVYDKEERRFFPASIRRVAQQRGFYSDVTESQLANLVEGPANAVFDRLLSGERVEPEDRRRLSLYIGVLLKRVPHSRERAHGYLPETLEKVVGSARAQITEFLEQPESNKEVLERNLAAIDGLEERWVEAPPDGLKEEMYSPWPTGEIVEAIAAMKWRIARSEGPQYFVTTDNPGFFFEAYGLGNPESEFVLPLSTEVVLYASWEPMAPPLAFVGVMRQHLVREMNRRLVVRARRSPS